MTDKLARYKALLTRIARSEGVTAAPWKSVHGDSYCAYPCVMREKGPHFIFYDATEEEGTNLETDVRWYGTNEDADFIALSRTMTPHLAQRELDQIAWLEDMIIKYREVWRSQFTADLMAHRLATIIGSLPPDVEGLL